ncbi:MAG: hypothetical protein ACC631_07750 [Halocynthiibacter sp.]
MQNRYVGDIGDFAKYSLLNALSARNKLGVAWYLYPDEKLNDDGRHTAYLNDSDTWRHRAPSVFDGLSEIVNGGFRNVENVVKKRVLTVDAAASEILSTKLENVTERAQWRAQWFERVKRSLSSCDLVFADPDNGLCLDSRFGFGIRKDWKRLPLSEAQMLAEGRTAVIYHHNSRFKGGNAKENMYWMEKLECCSFAVRFRAYSARTFFVLNATKAHTNAALDWSERMGKKAEVMFGA